MCTSVCVCVRALLLSSILFPSLLSFRLLCWPCLPRCLPLLGSRARDTRSHNNSRHAHSKAVSFARSPLALSPSSLALSLSLPPSRVQEDEIALEASPASLCPHLAGSTFNGRVSAGGASPPFVGRPPPLSTDKRCCAAKRTQSSVVKRPFAIIEANWLVEESRPLSPPSPPPVDCVDLRL